MSADYSQTRTRAAGDAAIRSAAWHLIPLLAVGYIISYIDRSNVGFAALTMNRELGLSATQFGFAAGTFYFGYCLFEVPSNLALRRFGARRWLARIMISWGLVAAGTCLAVGPISFSIFRFLTGPARPVFSRALSSIWRRGFRLKFGLEHSPGLASPAHCHQSSAVHCLPPCLRWVVSVG